MALYFIMQGVLHKDFSGSVHDMAALILWQAAHFSVYFLFGKMAASGLSLQTPDAMHPAICIIFTFSPPKT